MAFRAWPVREADCGSLCHCLQWGKLRHTLVSCFLCGKGEGVRGGHWGCAICAFLTLSSLAVARPTVWSRVDEDVRPLDCVPLGSVRLIPLGMWVGGYHQLPPHTAGPWEVEPPAAPLVWGPRRLGCVWPALTPTLLCPPPWALCGLPSSSPAW